MRTPNALAIFGLLLLVSLACSNKKRMTDESAKNAIERLMQQQEAAWNSGDIKAFMRPYHPSDSLIFVSKAGVTMGWQQVFDNYVTSYPSQKQMGTLTFVNLHYNAIGNNYIQVIGQWKLNREPDIIGGFYTLIWEYREGRWYIISDHTS